MDFSDGHFCLYDLFGFLSVPNERTIISQLGNIIARVTL